MYLEYGQLIYRFVPGYKYVMRWNTNRTWCGLNLLLTFLTSLKNNALYCFCWNSNFTQWYQKRIIPLYHNNKATYDHVSCIRLLLIMVKYQNIPFSFDVHCIKNSFKYLKTSIVLCYSSGISFKRFFKFLNDD